MCRAQDLGSYAKGQGQNRVRGQIRVSAITLKCWSKFDETSQEDKV